MKQPKENWIYLLMILGGCVVAILLGILFDGGGL
jgi:hypothetical protein